MKKRFLLYFDRSETDKPIVYQLVKDFGLEVNIFRAKVTPDEYGYLVLDLTGDEEKLQAGVEYLETFDIKISDRDRGLSWDETKCTSCGNCIPHCPTEALRIADPETRRVEFDGELCIDCLSCIDNCPFSACSSIFSDEG